MVFGSSADSRSSSAISSTIPSAIRRQAGRVTLPSKSPGQGSWSKSSTGAGIVIIPRASERFFRAASHDIEGSGLGLAIGKAAADRKSALLSLENRRADRSVARVTVTRDSSFVHFTPQLRSDARRRVRDEGEQWQMRPAGDTLEQGHVTAIKAIELAELNAHRARFNSLFSAGCPSRPRCSTPTATDGNGLTARNGAFAAEKRGLPGESRFCGTPANDIGEVELAVRALPQQETGQADRATRADDEVGVREPGRIEMYSSIAAGVISSTIASRDGRLARASRE